ncbi:hypothetical protein D3C72_694420 [compost metagenome]
MLFIWSTKVLSSLVPTRTAPTTRIPFITGTVASMARALEGNTATPVDSSPARLRLSAAGWRRGLFRLATSPPS